MKKTLSEWLLEYGDSHQNKWNVLIHKICVPLIFMSIYWLFFSIPVPANRTMYLNSANIIYLLALIFWIRLNWKLGIAFLLIGFVLAMCTMYIWSVKFYTLDSPFRRWAVIIFVLAWIGQFIGHKIEGKKPSFLKDIQFLLIGPIWVFYPKSRLK